MICAYTIQIESGGEESIRRDVNEGMEDDELTEDGYPRLRDIDATLAPSPATVSKEDRQTLFPFRI